MLKYFYPLILLAASPVVAQSPAAAPSPNAKSTNPLDKMVCRTEETLGSRLNAHRVCATLREWKD